MDANSGHSKGSATTPGSPNEVIDAVRELIDLMGRGGISELDLSTGDMTIRLRGSAGLPVATTAFIDGSTPIPIRDLEPVGHLVTSPMIGTYYSSPSPGEAPFVQPGDEVEVGQVIGIIEAMKIMNEIISDRSGVVVDVLVENAQPVEYGSPLIRLTEHLDALS